MMTPRQLKPLLGRLLKPHVAMFVIAIAAVAARWLKAHTAGIIHDEAITVQLFGGSLRDAVSSFPFPNNHVPNSLAIAAMKPLSAYWSHYARVPALLHCFVYVGCCWRICEYLLRSEPLRVATFACLVMNWYVIDITVIARGYSGMLAWDAMALAVLVARSYPLIPAHTRSYPLILRHVIFGAAIGLATAHIISNWMFAASMCLVYGIKAGISSRRQTAFGRGLSAAIAVIVSASVCAVMLGLMYGAMATQVLAVSRTLVSNFQRSPVHEYLIYATSHWYFRSLWWKPIGEIALGISLVCLAIGTCVRFSRCDLSVRNSLATSYTSPASYLVAVTAAHVGVIAMSDLVFGIPCGNTRNHAELAMLLPLMVASAVDRRERTTEFDVLHRPTDGPFAPKHPRGTWQRHHLCGSLVMWLLTIACLPTESLIFADGWARQSAIGPLLKDLAATDALRSWRVVFSPAVPFCSEIVDYYAALETSPFPRFANVAPVRGAHYGVVPASMAPPYRASITQQAPNVFVTATGESRPPPPQPRTANYLRNARLRVYIIGPDQDPEATEKIWNSR
jgi:hypothetical protein